MRKSGEPMLADSFDAVTTKLEAFADHFEHLATTTAQRELAAEFSAFVGEIIQAMFSPGEPMGSRLAPLAEKEAFQKLHGHETWSDLFKEIRADEAAGKRDDAHCYGREAFRKILDGKTEAPAVVKGKDRDIERDGQ